MTVTIDRRTDINLDTAYRVAWQGENVVLSPLALARVDECRRSFLSLVESDPSMFVYGVTTGFNAAAKTQLDGAGRDRQAQRKPFASAVLFGDPLPERVVRTIVLSKLTTFVEGHAAVTPELAKAVAAMLDGRALPEVPADNNDAAGQINMMTHAFYDLFNDYDLQAKESNALLNGTSSITCVLADSAISSSRRLALAVRVFALSIEAFQAPLEHYDVALARLWGGEHEIAAAEALNMYFRVTDGDRRTYQAPVSFRAMPRVLARVFRAVAEVEKAAEESLAGPVDNPIYLPPDADYPLGRLLHNSGFHNAISYSVLDELAACWADLCLAGERQTSKMQDGPISRLPHWLTTGDIEGPLRYLAQIQVGYVERARRAAQRTFIPGSESGGFGQSDFKTPTQTAWLAECEAGRCLDASLAMLAVTAMHALDVTERQVPPSLTDFAADMRKYVPKITEIRMLGPELGRLTESFTNGIYNAEGPRQP